MFLLHLDPPLHSKRPRSKMQFTRSTFCRAPTPLMHSPAGTLYRLLLAPSAWRIGRSNRQRRAHGCFIRRTGAYKGFAARINSVPGSLTMGTPSSFLFVGIQSREQDQDLL